MAWLQLLNYAEIGIPMALDVSPVGFQIGSDAGKIFRNMVWFLPRMRTCEFEKNLDQTVVPLPRSDSNVSCSFSALLTSDTPARFPKSLPNLS